MIGESVSHYEIIEKIGAGGMGEIYRARDSRLGREVAIKFLPLGMAGDRRALDRFRREARAASALNHPHICMIHDIGEHDDRPYIVMELLSGETLHKRIINRPLANETIVDLALQIVDALDAAHTQKILHRDIKPANVFVTERGTVKLLDFGLAKPLGSEDGGEMSSTDTLVGPLTAEGSAVGTPFYMSPEQWTGAQVDARSDIFSFGVVLYQMATGTVPFKGKDIESVFMACSSEPPEPPLRLNPSLPPKVEYVILRALDKDPDARYQSAREMRRDLELVKNEISSQSFEAIKDSTSDDRPSIAVLPFSNMSPDPENEYFSDGLAEELINSLTQLEGVRVTARTSAFSFKNADLSIPEIGRRLGVTSVLEGSVRRAGDRLRITAQLINVGDGYHIWSKRYDRELKDIFDLQDEITEKIIESLRGSLLSDRCERRSHLTENLRAYDLYLRGRYCLRQRGYDDVLRAIDYFTEAAREDPDYVLPNTGLSECYTLMSTISYRDSADNTLLDAKNAALRALELDDCCAEAHCALALTQYRLDHDWTGAERSFRRALEINPEDAGTHHHFAMFLVVQRRFDEAISAINTAQSVDPLSPAIGSARARILEIAGRYDEAIEACRRTLELHPGFSGARFVLGETYMMLGEYEKAIEEFNRLDPHPPILKLEMKAAAYALMGQEEIARRLLAEMQEIEKDSYVSPFVYSAVLITLGELDEAFEYLERAYAERDANLVFLYCEPMTESIREDPRYIDVIERMGFPRNQS